MYCRSCCSFLILLGFPGLPQVLRKDQIICQGPWLNGKRLWGNTIKGVCSSESARDGRDTTRQGCCGARGDSEATGSVCSTLGETQRVGQGSVRIGDKRLSYVPGLQVVDWCWEDAHMTVLPIYPTSRCSKTKLSAIYPSINDHSFCSENAFPPALTCNCQL
jgi:hypothetical protein